MSLTSFMRKKSGKRAAERFRDEIVEVGMFVEEVKKSALGKKSVSWTYEIALLKLTVAFERVMLECLVTAINNDTKAISERTGVNFPKHLTDEVSEYLVVGTSYFDFRGARDGLIKKLKEYLPDNHWLVEAIKSAQREPIDKLFALRNWAAHESKPSKRQAIKLIDQPRATSAGSWLKSHDRFDTFVGELMVLADDLRRRAPY